MSCFQHCPYQYKLRYVDKLTTIPDQSADNALYLGTALHLGLETGDVEAAIEDYKSKYYLMTDLHVNEEIKLRHLIPKALSLLPEGECEVPIKTDFYIGFIDRLVPLYTDNSGITHYAVYDYKYSNAVDRYITTPQLHLYKYWFEYSRPNSVVDSLRYLFVPKINIRQKKTETIQEFRHRLRSELEYAEPKLVDVEYDESKVKEWLQGVQDAQNSKEFPRNETRLCGWCEFQDYCLKGQDWMIYKK